MGERRTFSDIAERIGAGTADFYDLLADGVKGFACSLWSQFPDQITQNSRLANSFARGFMNNVCASEGNLPSPPTVPFTGGQCDNLAYNITVNGNQKDKFTNTTRSSGWSFTSIPGVLTYIDILPKIAFDDINTFTPKNRLAVRSVNSVQGNQTFFSQQNNNDWIWYEITSIRVTVVGGGPDTCGDPPLQYPPTAPTTIDYTTNITVNNNDGTDLTIPLVYAPIDFNFPMNFDLGGIDVVIDLGGIDFNFGPGGVGDGGGQLPDGQQDPLPIPKDNPGGGNTSRKFPPPNTEDFEEIIKEPSTEDTEVEGGLLDYVTLQLTTIPANANTQVWVDGATVYYCGWFAFISDTFVFKREPIHFEFTIWNAPKGATGYQYQLYPGFQATATVYKRKINQNGGTNSV